MSARRRRLIVVSNRGPVAYGRDEAGRRTAGPGAGGLASALRGLLSQLDVTWIASAMSDEDRIVAAESEGAVEERTRDGSAYRLRLVAHDPKAFRAFYETVANPTLWFLQHYLFDLPRAPAFGDEFATAWHDGYLAVNGAFAEAVCAELERDPEATVFFQDYHLYLAPRVVRERHPAATLAHFVHIPWPQPDYWRILPAPLREGIHDGLLANDLVGFHTERWRRSFQLSCLDVLGAEQEGERIAHRGRATRVVARPISVDPAELESLAGDGLVQERRREIQATRPERLIVRVDRTDPTKNVLRGFSALRLYLERHPEMVGRVAMLALLDASRQEIPEYVEYLAAIEASAKAVNERFATVERPAVELRVEDDVARSLAAYAEYDVLLVNAVYDGLNLVAKEAPLVNERDGVVVLSENTGAHEELAPWVISVNPFDVREQAEAIHRALELSEAERRAKASALREHVRAHDLEAWVEALLRDLELVAAPTGV